MKQNRRHKRYSLDQIEITGKMSMSDKVKILDISLGGVAFKVDRRLIPGREYMITLQDKKKTLNVSGVIARSVLCGMEPRDNGESVAIYEAGMQFKNTSADQIADFLKSIVQNQKEPAPLPGERRVNVRFQIIAPLENVLIFPAHFRVKKISLSGMLIQTDHDLATESKVPMVLSLQDGATVNFTGRVVSCTRKEENGQTRYDIGTEFSDLKDKDKTLLQTFIDQWATIQTAT